MEGEFEMRREKGGKEKPSRELPENQGTIFHTDHTRTTKQQRETIIA
jgi:hypothetical protein